MYKKNHPRKQRGIATLGITLMLLFIVTLVTLYTAKTSIKEQQISANQYRADQSLSTGNAALDWGIAHYEKARGFFCDEKLIDEVASYYTECPPPDGRATLCTIKSTAENKCVFTYTKTSPLIINPELDENTDGVDDALSIGASEMYYAFVDNGENCDTDGDGLCEYIPVKNGVGERRVDDKAGENLSIYKVGVKIVGVGRSDDRAGMRTISIDVDTSSGLADPDEGGSGFPLISKEIDTASTGNITVVNRFENKSVWTGNDLEMSGSTNTYVLDERTGLNCNDILNHDECVRVLDTDGKKTVIAASFETDRLNADIIDGDPSLANLNPEDFFFNFFGNTKTEVRQKAAEMGHLITGDDSSNLTDMQGNSVLWKDLADMTPLVWIDMQDHEFQTGGNALEQLGTELDPMVLVLDGDMKIGGSGDDRLLVGVLYVTGTWDASANQVVQGMMIVEDNSYLQGGGTPTLIYDRNLFGGKLGPPPGIIGAPVSGSWKDWE